MDIRQIILKRLKKNKKIKVTEVVKATGFSRAYVSRFFQGLKNEGKIILIGKANKAHYVISDRRTILKTKKSILKTRRILENKNLAEDLILDEIKRESGVFFNLPKNISSILDYGFSEMLNNAIVHSGSKKIEIKMERDKNGVCFEVRDWGVGIFNNLMKKRKLKNEYEAIQDLLKGKQTTAPKEHTGEGIFFTSKVGDMLTTQSSTKKLIFNNIIEDIFIREVKSMRGTRVDFSISLKSKRNLDDIFKKYSEGVFAFNKTTTRISLYKLDSDFISRSQARRVLSGLEKFKKIILDFKDVDTAGQGFADEVFRVWGKRHSDIKIEYKNANNSVIFMIKRALTER
jgi:anti-sigma regulatory factor (Ser/Thr protein kinase)